HPHSEPAGADAQGNGVPQALLSRKLKNHILFCGKAMTCHLCAHGADSTLKCKSVVVEDYFVRCQELQSLSRPIIPRILDALSFLGGDRAEVPVAREVRAQQVVGMLAARGASTMADFAGAQMR
ncbi:MAG: hypothetical protein ACREO8_03085, partial [Luteimonas sp.]